MQPTDSRISKSLDEAITEELNNPPKDIMDKQWNKKSDEAWDRQHGMILGSKADKKLDKKRGLKND
jgi:hypothetical protein